jgi:hypothetical protein
MMIVSSRTDADPAHLIASAHKAAIGAMNASG